MGGVGPIAEPQRPREGAPETTLLVVDDDDNVRRALRRVLRRTSCRVLDAPEAASAIALWMVMRRWASSQGFQMNRKISERFTASSIAVESAWPVRSTRWIRGHRSFTARRNSTPDIPGIR